MTTWALVPMKARSQCKTRLASRLSPEARIALVDAMLDHVIATLRAVPTVDRIAIVSSDHPGMAEDLVLLPDPEQDLNESLNAALDRVSELGARRALVVAGDLPLLRPEEVDSLLSACGEKTVALAPDRTGRGTNALALSLPSAFRVHFGVNSFARHRDEAQRVGLVSQPVNAPGLAFDVDLPEHFDALFAAAPTGPTLEFT